MLINAVERAILREQVRITTPFPHYKIDNCLNDSQVHFTPTDVVLPP